VIYPEDGTLYSFTTHGKKDLTIGCFSDVHNEGYGLSPLFSNEKLMNSCDLLVNIGDMLSNSNGLRSIFIGYLDAQLPFASKKPILNFRGNHEYVGCSPNTFFDVFGTPDFKGYSMTRFGDVCLIGLDVWNSEQRKWLKEAIKHPDFQTAKHRILITHFPATHAKRSWAATLLKTLDGIFTGKDPAATIDLLVAGHIHTGSYTKKNTGVTVPTTGKPYPPAVKVPFDMVVNEGARGTFDNCMTLVEVKGDSMTVKMLRLDGSVSKEYKVK
jgi:predicted phosphodiesterase